MAVKLTKEQRSFLAHHGIGLEQVFDADGMSLAQYRPLMKAGGFLIAVNVTPCERSGHGLRNRYGKCVECRPDSLAHARRYRRPGFVYVAESKLANLLKVGSSEDLEDRVRQMNLHKLGGHADWTLLQSIHCADAGRYEHEVHVQLEAYSVRGGYGTRPEESRELFRCDPMIALMALHYVGIRDEFKEKL